MSLCHAVSGIHSSAASIFSGSIAQHPRISGETQSDPGMRAMNIGDLETNRIIDPESTSFFDLTHPILEHQ